MAGSEIPVREFTSSKVASLTPGRPLTLLERESSTGISLRIL